MRHPIEPRRDDPDAIHWTVGEASVSARRLGAMWVVERSWAPGALALPDEPAVGVGLGDAEAVAHLERPILLPPGREVTLFVEWPLAVLVESGGEPIDAFRPGMRNTLLGAVEDGRVLAGARCAVLAGPADARARTHAAVHVVLANHSPTRMLLRRFPILEGPLALFRSDEHFAAGSVEVTVADAHRAEAQVARMAAPVGFVRVAREAGVDGTGAAPTLKWFVDATRRSTEFQL